MQAEDHRIEEVHSGLLLGGRPIVAERREVTEAAERALSELRVAASPEDAGHALLRYMGSVCERAAVFMVADGALQGWGAVGPIDHDVVEQASMPLGGAWALRKLMHAPQAERMSVMDGPTRALLLRTLGSASNAVFVPVQMNGQVTVLAVGVHLTHDLHRNEVEVVRRQVGDTLERLYNEGNEASSE